MSVALIRRDDALCALANADPDTHSLPDLAAALTELANIRETDALDEIRRRAEAQALYEQRSKNRKRERYFGKLRLCTEAALGVIAYDDKWAIKSQHQAAQFKTLAAALERGKLLDILNDSRDLRTNRVAYSIRAAGLTYVDPQYLVTSRPGSVPWSVARRLEMKCAPSEIPPDTSQVEKMAAVATRNSEYMYRLHEAQKRLERMKNAKTTAKMAAEIGPKLDKACSLLRKTLQAFGDAQAEIPAARRDFSGIFYHLYEVEDELKDILTNETVYRDRRGV